MKSFYQKFGAWGRSSYGWLALCSGGAAGLVLVGEARATIVYSGQKNIAISSNYEGVYINVTAPESSTSASGSWDLNPFFGGLGIANSPGFQPARSGAGNEAPILALALGMSVGSSLTSSLTYSSDWGGSGAEDASGHLGPGAGQFKSGQTGYLGFKLLSGNDVNYGWMRVNLTSNGETGSVLDWAYDNTGSPILTGAVAPLGAQPIVGLAGTEQTLSPSQAGTGLLIENGAKIIFNEAAPGSTYAGSIQGSGEIKISGAGGLGLSGGIAGTGSLSKDGAGTLTLSGSNSYNGGTTVNAGGLAINSANALGSGALTLAGGTTIDNTSGAAIALTTNNPVNVNGNLTFGGSNDLNLGSGAVTLSANPQVTLNGTSTLTIGGAISGASDLTKAGTGTMVLAGSNNFTGALTVSGGIVSLATNTAVAGTSGVNLSAGTGLTYTGGAATIDRNITVTNGTGTLRNTGGGTLNLSGNLSKNGSVLTLAGGSFNITGVISGASADSDIVVDSSTVTYTTANTYNGPTFLRNSSTLNANVVGALPTSPRSAVTFDGTGTSVLSLGAAQSVASLTAAGTATVTLNANTLTLGDSTGTTTFAGVISGSGGLIKDGVSTQVLTGANTYTGETTISAGTLEVSGASGALSATSAVNINGGTLLLGGSVTDRISNTAAISLGADTNSILQLSGAVTETLGALTLVGGAGARVIDFGTTSGVLTFASLTATSHLPLHIWNWSGGTDRLIISSGVFGGSLTASDISFFSGSGTGLYSGATMFASGGELAPVPEASTLLAVLGLIVPLAWRERRHWMRCREARGN
jgi:autotransporter-associated beta strand protein